MTIMSWIIALVVAITIIIAIHAYCKAKNKNESLCPYSREQLTSKECGLSSEVKLNQKPLSRYTVVPNMDSHFADLEFIKDYPATITARHVFLAQKCDETPGCVAFTSAGQLKSGVLPPEAYVPAQQTTCPSTYNCGLYIRKCAEPEPLYADFYNYDNFNKQHERWLVAPGSYPDITQVKTVDGAGIPNDEIYSIKVPKGLRVTIYEHGNYGGKSAVLEAGDYPYSMNGLGDKVSSFKIEYAPQ